MNTFCLRPTESKHAAVEDIAPIYNSGTSGAVWNIGGVLCKVKSWQEGTEQEKDTLDSVRKRFSGIPLLKFFTHGPNRITPGHICYSSECQGQR
jgi:hypothetical protein